MYNNKVYPNNGRGKNKIADNRAVRRGNGLGEVQENPFQKGFPGGVPGRSPGQGLGGGAPNGGSGGGAPGQSGG